MEAVDTIMEAYTGVVDWLVATFSPAISTLSAGAIGLYEMIGLPLTICIGVVCGAFLFSALRSLSS